MKAIKKTTLEFLNSLKDNNNRDWFIENKEKYYDAKSNFEDIVQEIITEITDFDPILKGLEVKSCVYRINRDIRFSNDKTPYKTHLGAFIVQGGKKNGDRYAGYYIHVEPGGSIIAGGAWRPPTPWLSTIRERIDEDPKAFTNILNAKEFIKYFGKIDGDKLKRAPRGYPNDHPYLDLLKFKSYLVVNKATDKEVLSEKFFDHSIKVIKTMKPFNDFLNSY
jgi:uncharacterized protein (TIGR02453 family)